MATNKEKKKNKKIKAMLIILIIILIIALLVVHILNKKISNIYVSGNNILSDKEIIKTAGLTDYPSFVSTYFMKIESKLLKNNYIKSVIVKRKLFGKIYLEVEEYNPICIYNNYLILSTGKKVENKYNIDYIPYVINNIDSIYDDFVKSFSLVDNDILLKISHIEYTPDKFYNDRFLLYMVDGNYVYITLSKIEKINKYNLIVSELDNKKGIIDLDLGNRVIIKD